MGGWKEGKKDGGNRKGWKKERKARKGRGKGPLIPLPDAYSSLAKPWPICLMPLVVFVIPRRKGEEKTNRGGGGGGGKGRKRMTKKTEKDDRFWKRKQNVFGSE